LSWAPFGLIGCLIVGFAAGVNNAWRAIRAFSDDAAKGGDRLP
jgi:ATP synthase protein I